MSILFLLFYFSFLLNSSLYFLQVSSFFGFFLLHFSQFCISFLFVKLLLTFHLSQLFLFKNFHSSLFKSFSNQCLQNRFNFIVKIEKISIPYLRLFIYSIFFGHKMSFYRSINIKISLSIFFIFRRFISQCFYKSISLCFSMSSVFNCRWSSRFELIRLHFWLNLLYLFARRSWDLCSVLKHFCIFWSNNCCICISSNDSFIEH